MLDTKEITSLVVKLSKLIGKLIKWKSLSPEDKLSIGAELMELGAQVLQDSQD